MLSLTVPESYFGVGEEPDVNTNCSFNFCRIVNTATRSTNSIGQYCKQLKQSTVLDKINSSAAISALQPFFIGHPIPAYTPPREMPLASAAIFPVRLIP